MIHRPGTFCYAELVTTKEEAARQFYGDLFDWTTIDVLSTSGDYSLFQRGDAMVAGLRQVHQGHSSWIPYVNVSRLEPLLTRARELGGGVVDGPFDIPGVARMATIKDPAGRVLGLWKDDGSSGAELQEQPGSMWWVEMLAQDVAAARAFYSALFGWKVTEMPFDHLALPYTVFKAGTESVGGITAIQPDWGQVPERWQVLFATGDMTELARRASNLGGSHDLHITIPTIGRMADFADDNGVRFGVMEPAPR